MLDIPFFPSLSYSLFHHRTPCGYCFVEFFTRQAALDCVNFLSGTMCDNSVIRCELDAGFKPGRQFGRGQHGGQYRNDPWNRNPAPRGRGHGYQNASGYKRKSGGGGSYHQQRDEQMEEEDASRGGRRGNDELEGSGDIDGPLRSKRRVVHMMEITTSSSSGDMNQNSNNKHNEVVEEVGTTTIPVSSAV